MSVSDDKPRGDEGTEGTGGDVTRAMPDEDATQVAPRSGAPYGADDAEVTRIAPPGEPATQALPGDAATRVLDTPPRALDSPPPVGREVWTSPEAPTATRSAWHPPRILWFILIGIAVGLSLAAAFALLTRGPDVEPFVGTWGPTTDSLGPLGGLVIEGRGDAVAVTVYSAQVEAVATVTAAWEGDDLIATLADGGALVDGGGSATLRIAHREDDDHLVVTIESQGMTAVQQLARVSALGPGPAETAPASAPTTPAPTATPTPTGSPDESPAPGDSPDAQVRAALTVIQVGVLTWTAESGGLFPPVAAVSADGEVGDYVDPWPTNPFTDAPMQPGSAPGDYAYEQLDAGRSYRLTGFLSDGATVVVP